MKFRGAAGVVAVLVLASACSGRSGPVDGVVQGPTAATSSPSATGTTAAPADRSVTIDAIGDILVHVPVRTSAQRNAGRPGHYDFAPMFAQVRPVLGRADLTLCHMETPLTPTNTDLSKPRQLVFNTPHEIADALHGAGVDGCDFVTNHVLDRGIPGIAATQQVFADAGLTYAGPSVEDRGPAAGIYRTHGLTIAQLAYSYAVENNWGPNTSVPPGGEWLKKSMWPSVELGGIERDARAARAAGADLVIVSLHWGEEYVSKPTAEQLALGRGLLRSKAVDLVLGTHVHVAQPCEQVDGRYVFYGLGNFLSNQGPSQDATLLPTTQYGLVAEVTLTKRADGSVTSTAAYRPTWVDIAGGHVVRWAKPGSAAAKAQRAALTSLGDCPIRADGS